MAIIKRRKPPDSRLERKIVTAMIINKDYLHKVRQIYTFGSLRLTYTQVVAEWCVDFFDEFGEAPGLHIQDIFHKKTKSGMAANQIDEVEEFLADISEEYEDEQADKINVDYLLKQTEEHFRLTALDILRVDLNRIITSNKIEEGEALIKNFQRITTMETQGVEPFTDINAISDALGDAGNRDKILVFPGALGKLVGDLERGYLMAFLANTGIGKTWWLLQLAWWAIAQGHNVLFVSFEMSVKKITMRSYQWATGKVLPRHAGNIHIPIWDCIGNQENTCANSRRTNKIRLIDDRGRLPDFKDMPSKYKTCDACRGNSNFDPTTWFKQENREALTLIEALKARSLMERGASRWGKFKVVQFPARSIDLNGLKTYIQNLEDYNGFVPDILITDYADKMMMSHNAKYREGIDELWDGHKSMAQERNILVATASQGNTVRDGKDLNQGSWAESITKLHLCDVAMRINQKPHEKAGGIYRIGLAKLRDDDFDMMGQAMVISCLKVGRPYLDSCLIRG